MQRACTVHILHISLPLAIFTSSGIKRGVDRNITSSDSHVFTFRRNIKVFSTKSMCLQDVDYDESTVRRYKSVLLQLDRKKHCDNRVPDLKSSWTPLKCINFSNARIYIILYILPQSYEIREGAFNHLSNVNDNDDKIMYHKLCRR